VQVPDGIDESLMPLLLEAYERFPCESEAWERNRKISISGATSHVALLISLRITPADWLRPPAGLPCPFGLRGVTAWNPMIPFRSPLPWCRPLLEGHYWETGFGDKAIPEHIFPYILTHGLNSADFNGRVGILQHWLPLQGRWQVLLASCSSVDAALKPSHKYGTPMFEEPPRTFKRENLFQFDWFNFKRS
jgi:hypothetical protein